MNNNLKRFMEEIKDFVSQQTSKFVGQPNSASTHNTISGATGGGITMGAIAGTTTTNTPLYTTIPTIKLGWLGALFQPDPELFKKYAALFSDKVLYSLDKVENELIIVKREDALVYMYKFLNGKNTSTDPTAIDLAVENEVIHLYYAKAPSESHPDRLNFSLEELNAFVKEKIEEKMEETMPQFILPTYTVAISTQTAWVNLPTTITLQNYTTNATTPNAASI